MKELRKVCLTALWFINSENKRADLARALASGDRSKIRSSAKKALSSVRDQKTKKQLAEILSSFHK